MEVNLNQFWKKVLHVVSVCGMFLILFGILSLLQMYTIGIIFHLNNIEFLGLPIFPIIYSVVSIIIINKYFKISSPYK
jgi:hypothetical protein